MSWESIENVKPAKISVTVPPDGVRVRAQALNVGRKGAQKSTRYIRITVGAELAKKLALGPGGGKVGDQAMVRILFGSGSDAGRIAISVDHDTGNFVAKRDKIGRYTLTINSATAAGRFALEFPPFTVTRVEAVRPENGQPRRAVFKASDAMLAVDD